MTSSPPSRSVTPILPPPSAPSSPDSAFAATSSSPRSSSQESFSHAAPAKSPAPSREPLLSRPQPSAVVVPYPLDVAAYMRVHAAMKDAPQGASSIVSPTAEEAEEERACPLCHATCVGKKAAHDHTKLHDVQGRWPCPGCGRESPNISSLSRHMATHGYWLKYECPHCSLTLRGQREHLFRHVEEEHPGHGLLTCNHGCNLMFSTSQRLYKHDLKLHSKPGTWHSAGVKELGRLRVGVVEEDDGDDEAAGDEDGDGGEDEDPVLPMRKRRRRREPRPFTCPHCPFAATDPCVLVHHVHSEHGMANGQGAASGDGEPGPGGEAGGVGQEAGPGAGDSGLGSASGPPWNCPRCCYVGISGADVQRHVNRVHKRRNTSGTAASAAAVEEAVFQCPECSFSTTKRQALHGHMSCHKQTRAFQCPYCDFCGKTKGFLARHIRARHPNKKYAAAAAATAGGMGSQGHSEPGGGVQSAAAQHDAGERPYKCPHCSYAAKTPGRLTRHKICAHKIDDEERPTFVSCPLCSYTAPSLQRVRVHIAASHMSGSGDVQVQ